MLPYMKNSKIDVVLSNILPLDPKIQVNSNQKAQNELIL